MSRSLVTPELVEQLVALSLARLEPTLATDVEVAVDAEGEDPGEQDGPEHDVHWSALREARGSGADARYDQPQPLTHFATWSLAITRPSQRGHGSNLSARTSP